MANHEEGSVQHKALVLDASSLEFIQKSITRAEAKKVHKDLPPGGEWRTMNGHHIYILNGKVLAGAIPGATGAKKATKAHLAEHQATLDKEAKKAAPKGKKPLPKADLKAEIDSMSKENAKQAKRQPKAKVDPKKQKAEIEAMSKENAKHKPKAQADPKKQKAEIEAMSKENAKHKKKQPTLEEVRAEGRAMLSPSEVPREAKRASEKTVKRKGVDDIRTEKQANNDTAYDVGEKIGGARKDEAAFDKFLKDLSGQSLQDIEKISAEKAQKLCVKKNIVKPVDFEAEHRRGVEINVAMTKALLYERIAPKPAGDTPEDRDSYLKAIQNLQRVFEPIKTWDEFKQATLNLREWIRNESPSDVDRYQRGVERYTAELNRKPTEEELTRSKHEVVQKPNGKWESVRTPYKITEAEWKAEQQTRIDRNKEALALAKKANANPYSPLGEKLTNFFTKLDRYTDGSISNSTIKTVEDKKLSWDKYFAQPASEEQKPRKVTTKEKWEKAMPAVVRRVGGRENKVKKPEDMVKTFNFRGVEFGNWVDDSSGNFHLVKCAEAFHDLADILKLSDKDISLNGRLAMAFGARGKGKALAHYEPSDKVINITKEGGAGSLAHEWGHALDNILYQASVGRNSTNYASEGTGDEGDPKVKEAYAKLVDTMLKGDAMEEVPYTGLKGYYVHPSFKQAVATMGMKEAIKFAADGINKAYDRKANFNKDYYGSRNPEKLEKELTKIERARKKDLNAMAQEMGYHHEKLTGQAPEKVPLPTGMSQYYVDSKLQGNTDYWTSTREMFARAFETYTEGKMRTGKVKNDYLVHGTWYDRDYAPYPKGEERDRLNAAFDELMEAVRKSNSIQKGLSFDLQKGNLLQCSRANSVYQAMKAEAGIVPQENRNAYNVPSTEGVFFIPINRLKCDYQTDKALNFDKVRENVTRMKNGENLEPVVIGYDYDVHDGHHRIEASKVMKYTHIPCIVGGSNEILKKRAEEAYSEVWKSLKDDVKGIDLDGEKKAILDYSERLKAIKDPKVKKVIAEILKDEKNHAFNLKKVLAYLEGDESALDNLQKSFDESKHPRDSKGEFTEVYHLTSNKDFEYDPNYKNTKQEMGAGLYTTPIDDALYWERALQDKEGNRHPYAIPIDVSKAKLLPHTEVPGDREVAKHLMEHFGSPKAALQAINEEGKEVSGDVLGNEPFRIAQHRLYAKTKGYDGLIMHDDREGNQVLLFHADNVKFKPAITTDELFTRKRKKDFGTLDVKSLDFDLQKAKKFEESEHPRDKKGEFTKKGSTAPKGKKTSEVQKPKKPLYSTNEGESTPKNTKGAGKMKTDKLPKRMSATNAKKHLGESGIPAGHREALLQTLEHTKTVNHFRPGEDGFEVQGSREVVGREYSTTDIQKAVERYKSDKKFAAQVAKASEGINQAEIKKKAEAKAQKEAKAREFDDWANKLKERQESEKQAKAAAEEHKRNHPDQSFDDFDPFELLMGKSEEVDKKKS